jgi:2-methylcitrate dehydratase PrpD
VAHEVYDSGFSSCEDKERKTFGKDKRMDILDLLTKNLIETQYHSMPIRVVQETKKQVLDTLAAIIAGSKCSLAGELEGLVALVKGWGGKEEATILAFGGQVPAPQAAFINGTLSVRLDFDDTIATSIKMHPSRAIVPTALAIAELRGKTSGREFLTAIALGHDLECRLRQERNVETAFGTTTGFFGAAATAAKIFDIDTEKLKHCLGLAFHQICGAQSGGGVWHGGFGANLKGVSNGFAVKAGVMAVLLAERGFRSNLDFFDSTSKNNFHQVFFGGSFDPLSVTADLGKVFMGAQTSQKAFPCCHGQQMSIEAALSLIKEYTIEPDQVERVVLRVSPHDYAVLGEPLSMKQNPLNLIETQFSLCWGVASALVYGKVGIENFTDAALSDSRVRTMAQKVFPIREDGFTRDTGFSPSLAEITTQDGRRYSKQIDYPFGSPERPMSFDDVAEKFAACCQHTIKHIPKEDRDRVVEMVSNLEELRDVGQIARLLG